MALLLSAVAASASWQASAIAKSAGDVDLERRLSAQEVDHDRTLQQPLTVLVLRTPVSVLRRLWPEVAARDVMRTGLALAATLWSALLFVILRVIGCRPVDAVIFTLIAMTSAASMLWFSVPATAGFASLSMLPALAMVAARERFRLPEWASALAVAASLTIDVANGLAGSMAAWFAHPAQRAVQVVVNGLAVVFVLIGVQQFLFPNSGSLVGSSIGLGPASALSVLNTLLLRAMVIPDGAVGLVGTLSWVALLGVGLMRPATEGGVKIHRYALIAMTAQLLICVGTGAEAVGVSATVIPWLIVLASLGTLRAAWRPLVLSLAVILLVSAAANNGRYFARSFLPAASMADDRR